MGSLRRLGSDIGRVPMYSVAATRAIERAAAAGQPAHALMERAGKAVATLAMALAPHGRDVLVCAGPGNNGGDGLDAAIRLQAMGKEVTVALCADRSSLPADAADALQRARAAGIRIVSPADAARIGRRGPALVIDALLGIGATRPPQGDMLEAIAAIARAAAGGARILAIDVPSGLDADRGQPFGGDCVVAHDTLTLLTVKAGLFTSAGRDHAGAVWFDALGVDALGVDALGVDVPDVDVPDVDGLGVDATSTPVDAWLVGRGDLRRDASPRLQAEHKGSFGDVAIVGGAMGMAGAALLAGRAAHAAGAGRVVVDLLGEAAGSMPIDAERPELMLRHGWWRGSEQAIAASTVVCGCGGGDAVRAALPRLLSLAPRLVLDADALNAISVDGALQAQLVARASRTLATVLTPHPLEAARLLGSTAATVQGDRLQAALVLAERFRCVIVLKGSGTIVAAPDSRPVVNATGNASLATAGTGDVLAGWIGGRWRNDRRAIDVAVQGVVEHGAAAEPELPGALRAADLVEALYRLARTPIVG